MAWPSPSSSAGSSSSQPSSSVLACSRAERATLSNAAAAPGSSGKPALASRNAQRFAQSPRTRKVLVAKGGRGGHEPMVGQPESQASRVLELVGAWQDVQGVHKVSYQLQVPRSGQSLVVPIACHGNILSCPPDRPRPERRCQNQQGRQPQCQRQAGQARQAPPERGTNEGTEVTEGRHSRGGRGRRLAGSVAPGADGERKGVGDPHPQETEANQAGSRDVHQQRAAEPGTGNDCACPEHPHGAQTGDEHITSQAPERYSTKEDA